MDACHRIHEILAVVDNGIRVVGVEFPVGSLLVAVDDGTMPNDRSIIGMRVCARRSGTSSM